jgi:hypothetical protein
MKALPPPRPNELSDLKSAPSTIEKAPEPPAKPPTLDIAILQAISAATAADTRALLAEAMLAYGGEPADPDWLDAVLGVFE